MIKTETGDNNKYEIEEEDLSKIVTMTKGYSGSDMMSLCREAAMMPVRGLMNIDEIELGDLRGVNVNDFCSSLNTVKPSVLSKTIQQYIQWNNEFGSFPNENYDMDG